MNSPSEYGGIAAVFVFGVGLLLVGKGGTEVVILAVGALALAVTVAPTLSIKALFVGIGALVCCAALCYCAASNELTGRAIYHGYSRGSRPEPVTRQDSPAKFRDATNRIWAFGAVSALVGVCGFMYFRKAESADDFP